MKVFGVSLGNRGGEFELRVKAVSDTKGKYQAVANGLVYCESDDTDMESYEEIRAVVLDGVRINTEAKEQAN